MGHNTLTTWLWKPRGRNLAPRCSVFARLSTWSTWLDLKRKYRPSAQKPIPVCKSQALVAKTKPKTHNWVMRSCHVATKFPACLGEGWNSWSCLSDSQCCCLNQYNHCPDKSIPPLFSLFLPFSEHNDASPNFPLLMAYGCRRLNCINYKNWFQK